MYSIVLLNISAIPQGIYNSHEIINFEEGSAEPPEPPSGYGPDYLYKWVLIDVCVPGRIGTKLEGGGRGETWHLPLKR